MHFKCEIPQVLLNYFLKQVPYLRFWLLTHSRNRFHYLLMKDMDIFLNY